MSLWCTAGTGDDGSSQTAPPLGPCVCGQGMWQPSMHALPDCSAKQQPGLHCSPSCIYGHVGSRKRCVFVAEGRLA
jgi:hypothetical protein